MRNKKGFTLIEIIGAIVILGIIAIIAFSTYTSSLRGFRENYYTGLTRTVEKSGEEFFNDNRNYRPSKTLFAQEVTLSTLETMNYLDKVVDYNGNSCNNKSYVLVVKEGKDKYSYHTCLTCENDKYDNTKDNPYCDRSWLDPTKVEYGLGTIETVYIYKGTTRDDLKEKLQLPVSYIRKDDNGNVIAEIRGTGEGEPVILPNNIDIVNTEIVGDYIVEYEYRNEKKPRTVVVYENVAPTISYQKEQTVATSLSGTTKVETDTYVSDTWAQNVIVHLSSNTYTNPNVTTSVFQWNLNGKWQDFCTTDPCTKKITDEINQTVQFRIVDSNGNISQVTTPIHMKIDNTKPKCGLTIPTKIGEHDWYNTDVVINFSEKYDQIRGSDTSVVSGVKKYNIQKSTATLNRTVTVDTNTHDTDTSSVTYIGYVEDEAENFNTCSVTFKRDATAPKCTQGGDNPKWKNTPVTITWGCNDTNGSYDISGCNPSNSGGSKKFNTEMFQKTWEVAQYEIKDNAGNTKTCDARTADVNYDKVLPDCIHSGDNKKWTNSAITINWGCKDQEGASDCDPKFSGSSIDFKTAIIQKTFNAPVYVIKDNAGNIRTCPARTADVYYDKVLPDCTNSGDNQKWKNTAVTIYWGCIDQINGSDCNPKYSGGNQTFNTEIVQKTWTVPSYEIRDNAGNIRTCDAREADVNYDKVLPDCTNSGDNPKWTNKSVTIYWGCKDQVDGSDCNPNFSGSNQEFNSTTYTSPISTYLIKDKAENLRTCPARTASVYVDTNYPTCTHSGDNSEWTTEDVTIYWGCHDDESECTGGGSQTFNTTTETAVISSYTITDGVGNTATCEARTANVYVSKTTTCEAGYYLPANTGSCAVCTANYYCGGGTFNTYQSNNQGISPCPAAYPSSSGGNNTIYGCYKSIDCGYYLSSTDGTVSTCAGGTYSAAHSVSYGNTSSCTAVSTGYYAGSGSCSQSQCPEGYRDSTGATKKSECVKKSCTLERVLTNVYGSCSALQSGNCDGKYDGYTATFCCGSSGNCSFLNQYYDYRCDEKCTETAYSGS